MEMMSQEIGELAQALANAQEMMLLAAEDAKNPFFKSKYANYNSIRDAVKKPLTSQGLSWTHIVFPVEGVPSVITVLMHKSGQWVKSVFPIPQTKGDAQSMGSAITYLKRYSLAAITGCATGIEEDDDGEKAMQGHRELKKPETKKHTIFDLAQQLEGIDMPDVQDYVKMMAAKTNKTQEYIIEQALVLPERLEKIKETILKAKESK